MVTGGDEAVGCRETRDAEKQASAPGGGAVLDVSAVGIRSPVLPDPHQFSFFLRTLHLGCV